MDDFISSIGKKISQGLSTVEGGLESAVGDVKNLFSSKPAAPTQTSQPQQSQSIRPSGFGNPSSNLTFNAIGNQPAPKPIQIAPTPKPYQPPAASLSQDIGQLPGYVNRNIVKPVTTPLTTMAKSVVHSPAADFAKAAANVIPQVSAGITGNQQAAQNAQRAQQADIQQAIGKFNKAASIRTNGKIDTQKLINLSMGVGEGAPVEPTPEELRMGEAIGMSKEDVAQAKSNTAKSPIQTGGKQTPYLLRKGIGVTPDMITDMDRRTASLTSTSPEQAAGQRIVNERNINAEQAAQNILSGGGTRDAAVKAYQDNHPGITSKDAQYRVSRVARQSNLALSPNAKIVNPEEGLHNLPEAAPGDYEQPAINKARVEGTTDNLLNKAIKSLNALTDNDRANFEDHLEGTKPLSEADNPDLVQQAIEDSKKLTDTGNAFDHSVGGKTPHIENYFPGYVDNTNPDVIAKQEAQAEQDLEEQFGSKAWNNMSTDERRLHIANSLGEDSKSAPKAFEENYGGYKNQNRVFANRAERRAAGIKDLYDDPRDALTRYANGLKFKIGGQAFKKAALEADAENFGKGGIGGSVQYGRGDNDNVRLSTEGHEALKGSDITAGKKNLATRINTGLKQSLIKLGVPHAVIIPPRYLGARLALETPELSGMLRGETEINPNEPVPTDNVEFGHQIDSPLHGTTNAGTGTIGNKPWDLPSKAVYNWLLPKLHNSLLSAARDYMDARGIDYDSPETRNIGHQINDVMGYSKNNNNLFGQATFAPSLIKSTANMYAKSLTSEGTIAKGGVIGQQLTNEALGFISKGISNQISQAQGQPQNKSKDNFWSTLIKEAVSPSVYTPYRNAKGEQIDLGIPGQYQADVARLFVNLNRDNNGQLGIKLNTPSQVVTNTAQLAKNVASPVAGAALSAITNQTYSGQTIRNPYAPLPTQAAQTGINLVTNALPINLQGLVNQNVAQHLPPPLRSAIQLNQNGPTILRLAGNTLGMNPKADVTTGQGPAIQAYYQNQDQGRRYIAANSNNPKTQANNIGLFNQYFSRAQNDSGQNIQEDPATRIANAKMLFANDVVRAGVQKALQANANHDPMWDLPDDKLKTFLDYQSQYTADPERTRAIEKDPWLADFITQRDNYFKQQTNQGTSVPDAFTAANPYPQPTPDISDALAKLKITTDPTAKAEILGQPGVTDWLNTEAAWSNKARIAEGALPLQPFPTETPNVKQLLAQMQPNPNGDKNISRANSILIQNNPELNQYLADVSLHTVTKNLAGYYLQTNPNVTEGQELNAGTPIAQSTLKNLVNLGKYDIGKNALGTFDFMQGGTLGTGFTAGGAGGGTKRKIIPLPKVSKVKTVKIKRAPKLRARRAKLAKSQKPLNIAPVRVLKPVGVAKPTQVVKLAR